MKEVKVILLILCVAGYTSLIWANAMFDWIKVGNENVPVGGILFSASSILIVSLIITYLYENWNIK